MLVEIAGAATDYLSEQSPLGTQITVAALSTWALQHLKKSKLPWLRWVNEHSDFVNRALSLGFAILSTSGIHAVWHSSPTDATAGTFALVLADGWINNLPSSAWKTAQSFVMQQVMYQGLVKHEKGQRAADIVADKVVGKSEELAEAVVSEGLRNDPNSLLKLAEAHPTKGRTEEPAPTRENKPASWRGPRSYSPSREARRRHSTTC